MSTNGFWKHVATVLSGAIGAQAIALTRLARPRGQSGQPA